MNLNQINNNSASQQNSQLCQSPTVRWHISKHIRLHRRRCKRNFKLYEHLKKAKKSCPPRQTWPRRRTFPTRPKRRLRPGGEGGGRERSSLLRHLPPIPSPRHSSLFLSLPRPTSWASLSHSESVVSRKPIPAPAREWQLPRQGGSVQQQHGGVLQGLWQGRVRIWM